MGQWIWKPLIFTKCNSICLTLLYPPYVADNSLAQHLKWETDKLGFGRQPITCPDYRLFLKGIFIYLQQHSINNMMFKTSLLLKRLLQSSNQKHFIGGMNFVKTTNRIASNWNHPTQNGALRICSDFPCPKKFCKRHRTEKEIYRMMQWIDP